MSSKISGKAFIRLVLKILLPAAVITVVLLFVLGVYPVRGNAMFPMLKDGDLVITQKIGRYAPSQVVAFRADGRRHFGRIIGVEGDEIDLRHGLLLNGMPMAEEIFYETEDPDGTYPVVVGEGQFFVLCDFRTERQDSRSFGLISADQLDGKAIFLFRRRSF